MGSQQTDQLAFGEDAVVVGGMANGLLKGSETVGVVDHGA